LATFSKKKKIILAGHQTGRILFYNIIGSKPNMIASAKISAHPITIISVMEDSELVFCGDSTGFIHVIDSGRN
jgi:hypothetical protein